MNQALAKKLSIGEIRRRELSQAAFEELVVSGIRGTTLEKVAQRAGVSKGVVLHHFKDKEKLFEAVMRRANGLLAEGVVELLAHSESPVERICAVIVGNFAEPIFNQQICHAWICLCAEAPFNPENRRIQSIIQSRLQSNLMHAIQQLTDRETARAVALQVSLSIDGVWLRASLRKEPLTMQEGVGNVKSSLIYCLSDIAGIERSVNIAMSKMENIASITLQSKSFSQKSMAYNLRTAT